MKEFKVLEYDFFERRIRAYDVIPYFVRMMDADDDLFDRCLIKDRETLKNWIIRASRYNFWSRCEYEFLMAPWPYSKETLEKDLIKIDVHEQIMMNIEVLTDILADEFGIKD